MGTVILGGGLSGLSIGYELHKKFIDFEILEKNSECGGLMRSFCEDGFTFDRGGSHILFSKNQITLNFMLNLLKKNKIRNRRNTKVLYKKRYVKYPFENGLSDLPKQENYECLHSFIQKLITKPSKKPENLKDWCYSTFGKGIAEKYLIPYNEKIWKYPSEKIGTDWVSRIPNPPLEDILKSSLGIPTEGYTHQLFFYYPKEGGIESLAQALLTNMKNSVTTNYQIKTIKKEGNKWLISNGKEEKLYDKIISTIPIQNLITSLKAPKEIQTAAANLKYNSLICVMLGINKPHINNLS